MNVHVSSPEPYSIAIEPLDHVVQVWRGTVLLAETRRAKVMYETRLEPTIYVPVEDMRVPLSAPTELQTFCPFKGTATYRTLHLDDVTVENAIWSYDEPLPESAVLKGYIGFMPMVEARFELGENTLRPVQDGNISGPLVDWLLRGANTCKTPKAFTAALSEKLNEHGVAVSRTSVMIWSLHPMIAAKHYVWDRSTDEVSTFAPEWENRDNEKYEASPLHFVAQGLGGVRQKLDDEYYRETFPIMKDLKEAGATDYVAMPMTFADGRTHVITLTCDGADGFSTAQLGLLFECLAVIGRFYEVFMQRENAQTLLETYVGKRSGARVLGGEIRRGDGDVIDAAIMFCDLRGSTRLEEELGRDRYIKLLNGFFEIVTGYVQNHGGEVLKFIGDAVLAVFPADGDPAQAKLQAIAAAREVVAHLKVLQEQGDPCDAAIGVDYGCVTYGNVGSRDRLDFTVIGTAANRAARLGELGKSVGERIVISSDVLCDATHARNLGRVKLHNVAEPVECHAVLLQ